MVESQNYLEMIETDKLYIQYDTENFNLKNSRHQILL